MADHRSEVLNDRVVFFSDAVFAIAATLLVLDLRPPTTSDADYEAAFQAYLSHPAPFFAVGIGFIVTGAYWMSHRRVFALLRETSGLVVWANLVFLFFVAIQPFVTAALAEHVPNVTTVLTYATVQVFAGVAQLGVWAAFLISPRALIAQATPKIREYVTVQLLRAPLAFAASIPVTLLGGPTLGMASWALVILLGILFARWYGHPEGSLTSTRSGPEPSPADVPVPSEPAGTMPATGLREIARDR